MCHGSIVKDLPLSGTGETEVAVLRYLYKSCSEKFRKINNKTDVMEVQLATLLTTKKILTQMFSCEFCEIFKNSFFLE